MPDSTSGLAEGALGVINKTFIYNPSTQGMILSISASVDKNLETSLPNAINLTNTFRPLIEQDGHIYLAAISGPTLTTGGSGGSTGFDLISQGGLMASDFEEYDFSTGTFDASLHPNFSGDAMLFGLGQIAGFNGVQAATLTAVYDNLRFDLVTPTPEPSSLTLTACLLLLFACKIVHDRARLKKAGTGTAR